MKIMVGLKTDNEATYEFHILKQLGNGLCEACRYVFTENLYGKQVLYDGKKQIVRLTDIQEKEIN